MRRGVDLWVVVWWLVVRCALAAGTHARERAAAGAGRARPAGGRWQGIGGSELGECEHVCMAGMKPRLDVIKRI